MTHDNVNLPMGGHVGYGASRTDFPSDAAFHAAQRLATLERYVGKGQRPVLYDCEICGGYHPNGFYGDCRQNLFRITDPDEVFGANGYDVIAMEEAE